MSKSSQQYDGPLFALRFNILSNGSYRWDIEFSGANYTGTTNLGYRASGTLKNLNDALEEFEIQVHDKDQAAWTGMPLSDRKDLRHLICETVKTVAGSVAAATPKPEGS